MKSFTTKALLVLLLCAIFSNALKTNLKLQKTSCLGKGPICGVWKIIYLFISKILGCLGLHSASKKERWKSRMHSSKNFI